MLNSLIFTAHIAQSVYLQQKHKSSLRVCLRAPLPPNPTRPDPDACGHIPGSPPAVRVQVGVLPASGVHRYDLKHKEITVSIKAGIVSAQGTSNSERSWLQSRLMLNTALCKTCKVERCVSAACVSSQSSSVSSACFPKVPV